jgi:hypothetical protein
MAANDTAGSCALKVGPTYLSDQHALGRTQDFGEWMVAIELAVAAPTHPTLVFVNPLKTTFGCILHAGVTEASNTRVYLYKLNDLSARYLQGDFRKPTKPLERRKDFEGLNGCRMENFINKDPRHEQCGSKLVTDLLEPPVLSP